MSTNPIKQAAQITKAYAEDREGLTRKECKGAGFSDAQCYTLVQALGTGAEGNITADEQKKLEEFRFAKDFIKNLAGDDGNKALQSRVKWLANQFNRKTFLTVCWRNCDAWERERHIRKLAEIGPAAAPAIPALIAALKDEDWDVRSSAARALGNIGPAAASAVPSLIAALKDENRNVWDKAVDALGNIGPAAVPALIAALKDKDSDVRSSAARALGQIGPAAASAVPSLIAALKDKNSNVRYFAAGALGNIGPAAASAVPSLIAALKDKDLDVCRSAAWSLGDIGDPHAIPPLEKMIRKDPNPYCRQAAQEAFDKLMEKFR